MTELEIFLLCTSAQLDAAFYSFHVYQQLAEELKKLPPGPMTEAFQKAIDPGVIAHKKAVDDFKQQMEKAEALADG